MTEKLPSKKALVKTLDLRKKTTKTSSVSSKKKTLRAFPQLFVDKTFADKIEDHILF